MERTEQLIVEQLRRGEEGAYRFLYERHYPVLCSIALEYVHDDFLAATIAGDIIFHIWEIRESLSIETSLRSYLIRSVRNRCLNYINSQRVKKEVSASSFGLGDLPLFEYIRDDDYPPDRLLGKELENEISNAIEQLPHQMKTVFKLSRFENKTYEEIAKEMGISVNTVKYHVKQALSLLRKDFLAI